MGTKQRRRCSNARSPHALCAVRAARKHMGEAMQPQAPTAPAASTCDRPCPCAMSGLHLTIMSCA